MSEDRLIDLATTFLGLKTDTEEAEATAKTVKEKARKAESDLADYMENASLEHVRLDGRTFYLHTQVHFSLTEANVPAIRDALLRDAGNDADFVQVGLNRKRVGEFYGERFKKGEPIPEALHYFTERRVGVRTA